ncbi:hypothetical protein DERF_014523 [Dermatophagoides farinae]|uniref:Uncharacterized protein n=1 Tax=Dermatophagoides farinae TaxID=6954 RepID=A0A922HIX4_DERFA|nr:hypothetical protein DERF_014523 [Dermatophagoides farinae]
MLFLIKFFCFLAIKFPYLIIIVSTAKSSTSSSSSSSSSSIAYGDVATANNQVIKLIIKSYVHEILENPLIHPDELKDRLARINDHIENHPALHQQYLWIIDTHDLFDNKVKVIQEKDMQQFVFTYRCAKNHGKCLGISPLYESECTERFGWMYMYYIPIITADNNDGDGSNNGIERQAQWGFVNAPHHCACKLKPKLFNHHHHQNNNHQLATNLMMSSSSSSSKEEPIVPNDL